MCGDGSVHDFQSGGLTTALCECQYFVDLPHYEGMAEAVFGD